MHFKDGRPNGQAILELETEEDVSKALERHRQYLGTRYIEGLYLYAVMNVAIIIWKNPDSPIKSPKPSNGNPHDNRF